MGKKSKTKGKTGERWARETLESLGHEIANRQIQGKAGDDIYATIAGVKWSIEVKHTKGWSSDYIRQAKTQARERDCINWMVIWKPTHIGNGTDAFIMYGKTSEQKTHYGILIGGEGFICTRTDGISLAPETTTTD